MPLNIIRTLDYEEQERSRVAALTVQVVVSACCRRPGDPRDSAQKLIIKTRQIVSFRSTLFFRRQFQSAHNDHCTSPHLLRLAGISRRSTWNEQSAL